MWDYIAAGGVVALAFTVAGLLDWRARRDTHATRKDKV